MAPISFGAELIALQLALNSFKAAKPHSPTSKGKEGKTPECWQQALCVLKHFTQT